MTGSSSSGQPTPAPLAVPAVPAVPGAVTTHAYLFHLVGIAESVLPVADSVCTPVGCRELRDSLFFHVIRHSAYREWRGGGAWHACFRAISALAAPPFSLSQARVQSTVRNVLDWVDDPTNADRVTSFAWRSGSHAFWVRYFTRLELVRAADPVLSAKRFALRKKVAELGIPRSTLSRLLKVLKRKSSARSRWNPRATVSVDWSHEDARRSFRVRGLWRPRPFVIGTSIGSIFTGCSSCSDAELKKRGKLRRLVPLGLWDLCRRVSPSIRISRIVLALIGTFASAPSAPPSFATSSR